MSLRRALILGVLPLLLAGSAYAQQVNPSPSPRDTGDVAFQVQLPDTVVVTASRVASAAQTTGRRVSVYTQQDIRDLSVNSVDQLLDVIAGLDVQSRGASGVQSDLKMRGSTFNGVLLLLDGARINDPYTGHFLMDLPVPLSEIARVEVLHGPATALYGPDALEAVSDATGGGLLSRNKKKGFINVSRKRGFHVCLTDYLNGEFDLRVPEL